MTLVMNTIIIKSIISRAAIAAALFAVTLTTHAADRSIAEQRAERPAPVESTSTPATVTTPVLPLLYNVRAFQENAELLASICDSYNLPQAAASMRARAKAFAEVADAVDQGYVIESVPLYQAASTP